jgi:hypothetical protein
MIWLAVTLYVLGILALLLAGKWEGHSHNIRAIHFLSLLAWPGVVIGLVALCIPVGLFALWERWVFRIFKADIAYWSERLTRRKMYLRMWPLAIGSKRFAFVRCLPIKERTVLPSTLPITGKVKGIGRRSWAIIWPRKDSEQS